MVGQYITMFEWAASPFLKSSDFFVRLFKIDRGKWKISVDNFDPIVIYALGSAVCDIPA